eukprot:6214889-Amphidinium_carterae.1
MAKSAKARREQHARAVSRRRASWYDQGFGAGIHHVRQEQKEKKEKEKKKATGEAKGQKGMGKGKPEGGGGKGGQQAKGQDKSKEKGKGKEKGTGKGKNKGQAKGKAGKKGKGGKAKDKGEGKGEGKQAPVVVQPLAARMLQARKVRRMEEATNASGLQPMYSGFARDATTANVFEDVGSSKI